MDCMETRFSFGFGSQNLQQPGMDCMVTRVSFLYFSTSLLYSKSITSTRPRITCRNISAAVQCTWRMVVNMFGRKRAMLNQPGLVEYSLKILCISLAKQGWLLNETEVKFPFLNLVRLVRFLLTKGAQTSLTESLFTFESCVIIIR